jgi:hypothetical protein
MSGEAEACVRAYEALRSHVLAGSSAGSHAGLVVLLRQGVAAWMARRLALTGNHPACACPAPAAARTTTLLVGEQIHVAIVRVLASMALAAQREVRV